MITRREFTKTLGSAALVTLSPGLRWALDAPKVSAAAAKIYRDSFILDGNALAWIGSLLERSNQDDITKVICASGVTALKSTLGGAVGAPRKMELIADSLLKRGHNSAVVEKILGEQFQTSLWGNLDRVINQLKPEPKS